jgi:ABC-type uncharacterized transport system ATPase subunit
MLKVQQLNAWYDHSHVIQGLDFEVRPGEIVTLMGRNGAGKTSTLRTIMGLVGSAAARWCSTARSCWASRRTCASTTGWPMCRRTAASCRA